MKTNCRLSIAIITAGLPAFLLAGCVSNYSPYTKEEIHFQSAQSPARELWQWSAPSNAEARFTAIAFPDDQHLLVGSQDGHISLWTIGGKSADKELAPSADPIAALAVSPDGATLVSASVPAADPRGSPSADKNPLLVQARTLATGKMTAMATDGGLDPIIRFHPGGHFFALTTADGRFFLHQSPTLETVFTAQHYMDQNYNFRTPAQPAFFLSPSEAPMDVLAVGKRWQIAGGQAKPVNEYSDQPDALFWGGANPQQGYFAERSYTVDAFAGLLAYDRRQAGVVVAPLERNDVAAYLVMEPNLAFFQVLALSPAGTGKAGWLAVRAQQGIILADLEQHRFSWLRKGDSSQIAASPHGRTIAACGTWGLSTWELPEH